MNYCPPCYEAIKQKLEIKSNKSGVLLLTNEKLEALIRQLLPAVGVDEEWYLRTYPDVRGGIDSGRIRTAQQHFVEHGYFEGRLPHDVKVDDLWYLEQYADVAAGIKSGGPSAKEHFFKHGYREGRLPGPAPTTAEPAGSPA